MTLQQKLALLARVKAAGFTAVRPTLSSDPRFRCDSWYLHHPDTGLQEEAYRSHWDALLDADRHLEQQP